MTEEKNINILKLLLLMAFADKVFMEEEKDLITKISSELKISNDTINKLIDEIEKIKNITEECRKIAKEIQNQKDRDKTIKLLVELMATDKIIHKKELFATQIIAEEWGQLVTEEE
tara:strand:+ start:213 stop:560 length:348 start_codon:yes stop_codon:yes gene_type:complete